MRTMPKIIKRLGKTTREQFFVYLEQLEKKGFQRFDPRNPDPFETSWATLVQNLNSCTGPKRSANQWRKVFADWKCKVKKKARELESLGPEASFDPKYQLSDIEERLIKITGTVRMRNNNGPRTSQGLQDEEEEDQNGSLISESGVDEEGVQEILDSSFSEEDELPLAPVKRVQPQGGTKKKKRFYNRIFKPASDTNNSLKSLNEMHILISINNSLKDLVELKRREVEIAEKKFQLKYKLPL